MANEQNEINQKFLLGSSDSDKRAWRHLATQNAKLAAIRNAAITLALVTAILLLSATAIALSILLFRSIGNQ